jgi:hypothetical protein
MRMQTGLRHKSKEIMSRKDIEEMISERDILMDPTNNKLMDNMSKGVGKGRELYQLKVRLYWRMKREDDRKKFNHSLNEKLCRRRQEVRRDHKN